MCVCMCGIIVRSEHNLSLALSSTAPLSPHCDFIFISACGNFISSTPLSSFASDAQFSPWGRKEKSSLVLNIWVQCISHRVSDNIQPAICFSLYHRICFFFSLANVIIRTKLSIFLLSLYFVPNNFTFGLAGSFC